MVLQADRTSCPPFVPPADSGMTDGANSLAYSSWINVRDKIPARLLMTEMLHVLEPMDSLATMAQPKGKITKIHFFFFFQGLFQDNYQFVYNLEKKKKKTLKISLPQNYSKIKSLYSVLLQLAAWLLSHYLFSSPHLHF